MATHEARRISRELTSDEKSRLAANRARMAAELPDLIALDRMRKEALEEPARSGELRRAIHASPPSLNTMAAQAGISALVLDEFLTGERTLRSDVMDRLAATLGYVLQRSS